MSLKLYRTILVVLVVASLAFISYNSLQNAESSAKMSNGLSEVVAEVVVPNFSEMETEEKEIVIERISIPVREMAHAIEFAMLAFFTALLAFTFPLSHGRYLLQLVIVLLFCFTFAMVDEWVQSFVSGRDCQWHDVWVDTLGSACGMVIALIIDRLTTYYRRGKRVGV